MQTLERSVEIDAPLETVFAFLTDIRNHARLSPPHSQEELVDPGNVPLKLGTTVRLRGRYGGIHWPLASRITLFEAPHPVSFCYVRAPQLAAATTALTPKSPSL